VRCGISARLRTGLGQLHALPHCNSNGRFNVFAAAGVLVSVIGALSNLLGKTFILSSWVWWALGVILLFVTASRLQWDLQKEKGKNRNRLRKRHSPRSLVALSGPQCGISIRFMSGWGQQRRLSAPAQSVCFAPINRPYFKLIVAPEKCQ
jgi:hypothetical protein